MECNRNVTGKLTDHAFSTPKQNEKVVRRAPPEKCNFNAHESEGYCSNITLKINTMTEISHPKKTEVKLRRPIGAAHVAPEPHVHNFKPHTQNFRQNAPPAKVNTFSSTEH